MSIRILIADDHHIIRDGLHALISGEPDLEVIGEAQDGRQAVKLARKLRPDVIIMDVAMPVLNGIEATLQIKRDHSGARIIALSMHSDRQFIIRMLEAGAMGYVLKDCAFEELTTAIQTVADGRTYLCNKVAGSVVSDYVELLGRGGTDPPSPLTPRESEVLQLLAEGKSTKEIAGSLQLSVKTIETHRLNMMDKLGVRSVAELTKYAIRHGLTSLD